ncbi:MAG: sialate O-acetylesterase [Ruminococcus sp.]|nr:sialate O-acetylesterase [Ruminococcus sp.]
MIKSASVFSSNMVLQREKNMAVWGVSDEPGTVTADLNGVKASCTVREGKWSLLLPPMEAGGPYEMTLSLDGKEFARYTNVMIGEVWLCGGQSNMELELHSEVNGEKELASLTADVPVRFYYTNKVGTVEEAIEAEKNCGWGVADPQGSRAWSAVGYYFARKLSADLGITVGLIGCNWGGTSGTNWIDKDHILGNSELASYMDEYFENTKGVSLEEQKKIYDEYTEYDKQWNERAQEVYKTEPKIGWNEIQERIGKNRWPGPRNDFNPFSPAKMFEAMLMRVCPYTLAGFLYYQGESDDHKPRSYYTLFTTLIRVWRERWGDDELPFIFVQLPGYKVSSDPDYKHWCLIREAQMRTFRTVKNTGIAVCIDCGELDNIHPVDKRPVGERLCLQAEQLVYGIEEDAFGPMFKDYMVNDRMMSVYLEHAEEGLTAGEKGLTGFELAGDDKVFYPAEAEIVVDCIMLYSDQVTEPKYARYAWGNFPEYSVFGKNGIPLAPFRTSMEDE